MSDLNAGSNIPTTISDAIAGIPKSLVPRALKVLDRLVESALDIPVAWLNQKKATIEAKTESLRLMEAAIARAAVEDACLDKETVRRAANTMLRSSYRKQVNKEAVAIAAIEDLRSTEGTTPPETERLDTGAKPSELEDDWLNVFERYAEDASTERMQKLWGRVMAGEIRTPGRYSMRTLRFLSEFSQADALTFSEIADISFQDFTPRNLVVENSDSDITNLIYLESAGLINGAVGLGLSSTREFDSNGNIMIAEDNIAIWLKGKAGDKITTQGYAVTPLGQELLSLLPGRDQRSAARRFANSMKSPQILAAYLVNRKAGKATNVIEVLWDIRNQT